MKYNSFFFAIILLAGLVCSQAKAGFPDDFSDVQWIDPDISSWAQTSSITVNVSGSTLQVNGSKKDVWPRRFHSDLRNDCCNRSLWIFAKYQGQWYATTFEYMRFGQVNKQREAVSGRQIKRSPFFRSGFDWEPADGEVYGFMTSGMARFNLNNVNVRERSNVALYKWGVGPTDNIDFEEVPRNARGGVGEEEPEPEAEPEPEPECTEPEPVAEQVNSHVFAGTASGTLTVTGENNSTSPFNDNVEINVSDDRSLSFTVSDETFTAQVAQDGSFSGQFTFDIGGLGICVVNIDVTGVISGSSASGSASGEDSCAGNNANFTATFTAQSQTTPSYLDQRTTTTPRSICGKKVPIIPILDLILTEAETEAE